ncbi:unnamed protein product [Tilletia caries]|uniref:Protein SQS1 n=1 Tax=Tilletia caries TaxID=13290 RepID=A0ABN7IWY3_9BASI|nr:unnamed protein product [Tilletia caries]CAD6923735.1 unnamed protein product [Tilletia controversa]CAD6897222.1 unnamed protein product [Tilletia caries]CAD6934968.1 unnamed protein product [Tilletia caries]CAD6974202.1 unnamed protein product [Tilletia controversa]
MGFNYAAMQGRRPPGSSGTSYTPLTATGVVQDPGKQRYVPPQSRGAHASQQQQQLYRGPRGPEGIIEDEDLNVGRTTTFRFSEKKIASGTSKGGLTTFGRRGFGNNRSHGAQPPIFVPATGDWINGAFVPFEVGADGKYILDKIKQDEDGKDKTDLERSHSPETELLRAEAVRPPGAGLGFGRGQAPLEAGRNTATKSSTNEDIDEEDDAPVQSRVEREREELERQRREEAETLLQELLREYATAPPDGRPSQASRTFPSDGDEVLNEAMTDATHDLPFQNHQMPFSQQSNVSLSQPSPAVDDEEIILLPPTTNEATTDPVTTELAAADSGASTAMKADSVASFEEVEDSIHTSVAVVTQESTSTAEPDSLPIAMDATPDMPTEPTAKDHVATDATPGIPTKSTAKEDVPAAAKPTVEPTAESDSEEEATEFDLSAMQSFVRSMDGQTGGRAMDMLDIAVEARIQEEEEWLTDGTDEEDGDGKDSSTPSDAPVQGRERAADKQDEAKKEDNDDDDDDDNDEGDASSEGSSADVGSLASEHSSDLAAEKLGRQRLIEQKKRREGKQKAGASGRKGGAKPELVMDEDGDGEEYDEDGVEVHWGDTDEEDEDGEDSDDSDDDEEGEEEDDDDDDDDEEGEGEGGDGFIAFGKGSTSGKFSWKKSDEDFLRQLEIFADQDDGKLTRKERRHRDRLYKAIENGEIFLGDDLMKVDDSGAEVLSRDALKRQKGKMRNVRDDDIWAAALQEQWNKDRMKKATKKAKRQAEREALANSPFVASHGMNLGDGAKLGKKALKTARRAEKRADRASRKESAALGLDDDDDDDEPAFAYRSTSNSAFQAEDHALGNRFAHNLVELNEQIQLFVRDEGKTTLSLPPMEKRARARVHELANAYNLISKSTGNGNNRYSILSKGTGSRKFRPINYKRVNQLVHGAFSGGSFGLRPKGDKFGWGGKSGGGGGGAGRGAPDHASKNQEGAQVGFGAEKIGEANIGHKLLKIMGWSEGTGIGIIEGGAEPIAATVKTRKGGLGF